MQSIEVFSVHRIPEGEEQLLRILRRFYPLGHPFLTACVPLALFDIRVGALDSSFDFGQFGQDMPERPGIPPTRQAAYDPAELSSDGTAIKARGPGSLKRLHEGRIAFYLHYYDPSRPLQWSYGEVACPPVTPIPRAFHKLMTHEEAVEHVDEEEHAEHEGEED